MSSLKTGSKCSNGVYMEVSNKQKHTTNIRHILKQKKLFKVVIRYLKYRDQEE